MLSNWTIISATLKACELGNCILGGKSEEEVPECYYSLKFSLVTFRGKIFSILSECCNYCSILFIRFWVRNLLSLLHWKAIEFNISNLC